MSSDRIVRINGNVCLNHIEAKHGSITKIADKLNTKLPKGIFAAVIPNQDRTTSVSSVIISLYGEYEESTSVQKIQTWIEKTVNDLVSPTESAIFDVTFTDRSDTSSQEQHLFAFSLSDGKIHHIKKFK